MNLFHKIGLAVAASSALFAACSSDDDPFFARENNYLTFDCNEQTVEQSLQCDGAWSIDYDGNDDWIAFVGIYDGHPYEIFTGLQDDDEGILLPKSVTSGRIIKNIDEDGTKRYDFQYTDRYGYTNTIGGISRLFNEEFWNYAKLISGVLRHGMPIEKTVSLIESLHLDSESINTWKTGVCRALKQYIVDGTKSKGKCPSCGQENMAYQNGCLTCMSCGYSKCG